MLLTDRFVPISISAALNTIFIIVIGQCIGAGDEEAAEWYMRKLTRLSIVLAVAWNAMVMILTPLLLPLSVCFV